MNKIISVFRPEEMECFAEMPLLENFDSALLRLHQVDEHILLINRAGNIGAHCSLWWRVVPKYDDMQIGVIGHYAADDDEAAGELLLRACNRLRDKQCTLAVGPMDGNTWRSYRFVTERGDEPPFFLEPTNPKAWPQQWRSCGFETLATYTSAVNNDLSVPDERINRALERLNNQGTVIRSLDIEHFYDELENIYEISVQSFVNNFLYTPIEKDEFIQQYQRVKPYVQPNLTFIAEMAGKPVAFLFAIPDMAQAQRGEMIDTVIIKTVAVLPTRISRGLGSILVGHAQRVAYQAGYKRAIHALMHENNSSRNISAHYAKTMRRYTLFAKSIT